MTFALEKLKEQFRSDSTRDDIYSTMISIVVEGSLGIEALVSSQTAENVRTHGFKEWVAARKALTALTKRRLLSTEFGEINARKIGRQLFAQDSNLAESLMRNAYEWFLNPDSIRITLLATKIENFYSSLVKSALETLGSQDTDTAADSMNSSMWEEINPGIRTDFPTIYRELRELVNNKIEKKSTNPFKDYFYNLYNNLLPRLGSEIIHSSSGIKDNLSHHMSNSLQLVYVFLEEYLYGLVFEKGFSVNKKEIDHHLMKLLEILEIPPDTFSTAQKDFIMKNKTMRFHARYPHSLTTKDNPFPKYPATEQVNTPVDSAQNSTIPSPAADYFRLLLEVLTTIENNLKEDDVVVGSSIRI